MKHIKRLTLSTIVTFSIACAFLNAADQNPTTKPALSKPTMANVPYGTHERQVLDFYQAKSDRPDAAALLYPRRRMGGGRQEESRRRRACLAAGISVVSINYRYSWQVQLAGVKPPVEGRCMMRLGRCNSCGARPRSGISTRGGSAPAAAPPAHARRCGLPFTMTWPSPERRSRRA